MPRRHAHATVHLPAAQAADACPDHELVEGIRGGSEADFNRLYERYFHRVYNFVFRRVRDHADAEEVVQETFAAVFRSIDGFRGQSSLVAWIYGIAKNTANNHIRRARAHEQRIERAEADQALRYGSLATCTPEENLRLSRYQEAIRERLGSLASWHAEAFALRHLEDLPIDEIARRVSRSNDAVRSSLYRVKKMLIEVVDPGTLAVG